MPDQPSTPPPGKDDRWRREWLILYDDFVDFHNTCAFFCEAVATMIAAHPDFDRATVEGLGSCSSQIRHRSKQLKEQFKNLLDEYLGKRTDGKPS